jgi:hypothetical protein
VRRDPQNQEGLAGQDPGVTGRGHITIVRERRRIWDTKIILYRGIEGLGLLFKVIESGKNMTRTILFICKAES